MKGFVGALADPQAHPRSSGFFISVLGLGCGSKPCTPGEHQNRWQMDVHPLQNGAIGSAPLPLLICPGPRNNIVGVESNRRSADGGHQRLPLLHLPAALQPPAVFARGHGRLVPGQGLRHAARAGPQGTARSRFAGCYFGRKCGAPSNQQKTKQHPVQAASREDMTVPCVGNTLLFDVSGGMQQAHAGASAPRWHASHARTLGEVAGARNGHVVTYVAN